MDYPDDQYRGPSSERCLTNMTRPENIQKARFPVQQNSKPSMRKMAKEIEIRLSSMRASEYKRSRACPARSPQQVTRAKRDSVTAIENSRQQQDLAKAWSAAATYDQCCLVEWSAEFHPVQYIMALEQLLGKFSVYQLMKVSGQVLVGLASVDLAERLVEEGLTIGTTLLKAFPGGYTWTTGNREAFVLLNEGRKLHQLPAKLVIISKGDSTPAYITYGVRCSKCHRQVYRRATCPLRINGGSHQVLPHPSPCPPTTPPSQHQLRICLPGANIPIHPQETSTPEPPVPAPSTSHLLRPEPFLAIIEPTAALKKKETHNKTAPSFQSSTSMTRPMQPLQESREVLIGRVEGIFEQINADLFLSLLYERFVLSETISTENKIILRDFLNMAIEHVGDKDPFITKYQVPIRIQDVLGDSPATGAEDSIILDENEHSVIETEIVPAGVDKNSRQQQDLAKARSAAATFDQCCLIEWSADFHPVQYIMALEQMLGKPSVYQLMKMSAREAFILLNEGMKLHQLPAKLVIVSKGESTPAYITYGVRSGNVIRTPGRACVEASLLQAYPHQQIRRLYTTCGTVCTLQADPFNALQPSHAFVRGELPCQSLRDSSPRASCSSAEHQPVAITTRALLD
ncbi:hypothetical protein LAZ67_21001430 [Cordylochernes scorpioides]|uniref:Uncharacterized protein n=1 Tax=Cordylochernes scorpioides TaxID=51811 RepID=A0ABY6LN11_9ARAC|nr:hypothetical protein LAZ67_21001430 [Cordylochernes scorpioides]